jgi:hypothetical protein
LALKKMVEVGILELTEKKTNGAHRNGAQRGAPATIQDADAKGNLGDALGV